MKRRRVAPSVSESSLYNHQYSATENENIENRKIDEQHKISLDGDFVWILRKRKLLKYGSFMAW